MKPVFVLYKEQAVNFIVITIMPLITFAIGGSLSLVMESFILGRSSHQEPVVASSFPTSVGSSWALLKTAKQYIFNTASYIMNKFANLYTGSEWLGQLLLSCMKYSFIIFKWSAVPLLLLFYSVGITKIQSLVLRPLERLGICSPSKIIL